MICCETVLRQKQNCTINYSLLLASGRKCGTKGNKKDSQSHREGIAVKAHLISSSQFSRLVEKDRLIRSLWNQIQPRAITFEPISAEEWCILAHIQHQRCVDSLCNRLVDHSYNRIHGIQRNWKLLLDLTTAYPSYGMEVQEAQAH